jgi:hypothetical protein
MAYSTASVTAFCGTGFSMINTPANATVLSNSATAVVDLGIINCLSLIGKKSGVIRVKAFANIATCDYLRIIFSDNPIASYWLVTGYEYLSGDTLSLSLVLDGFLTCGGTAGITAISGYVNRHTVTDDTYGKYNQSDDMLVPSQHLVFRSVDKFGLNTATEKYYNVVLSTINLLELGTRDAEDMGLTYGDMTVGEGVTVPQIPQIPETWKTKVQFGTHEYEIPGAFAFDLDGTAVVNGNTTYPIREGIARARSLGVEGGIIAMYSLPKSKFECEETPITISIKVAGVTFTATLTALIDVIKPATGVSHSHSTSINFNYETVNNKRALYGDYHTVKVASMASGEVAEYEIEDLYSPTAQNTNVVIKEVGDGRAHGKPYFYPEYFMDVAQDVDNLLSSIAGLEWQNVPIVFQYSSGEGIQRNKYFATTKVSANNMLERQQADQLFKLQSVAQTMGGLTDFSGEGLIGTGTNTVVGVQQMQINQELQAREWVRARMMEKKDLLVNTRVVAPEINFPASESIRDFVGNGVMVAFCTPQSADLARFDKILTMYGYKDAGTALSLSDLTAGRYFSYIEATGVQIQTSVGVDKTTKEMAEEQIASGIRIWKQRPDFSLYNSSNR